MIIGRPDLHSDHPEHGIARRTKPPTTRRFERNNLSERDDARCLSTHSGRISGPLGAAHSELPLNLSVRIDGDNNCRRARKHCSGEHAGLGHCIGAAVGPQGTRSNSVAQRRAAAAAAFSM